MARKFLAILAALTIVIGGPAAAPGEAAGPDYKFISNGDFASYYDYAAGPIQVYVTRTDWRQIGWGAVPTFVWMNYYVGSLSGYGNIPESSLTGGWGTGMSLHIDTSTLAAPEFTQNNAGGVIHLTFAPTHEWRGSWSGREENTYTWGSTTWTNELIGSRTTASASVSGMVLGTAVSSRWANLGRDHQVQFSFVVTE